MDSQQPNQVGPAAQAQVASQATAVPPPPAGAPAPAAPVKDDRDQLDKGKDCLAASRLTPMLECHCR